MFVRIKKIKGIQYAYLVKSVWKEQTAQQKVVKYLGKVYVLEKTSLTSFAEFCDKENMNISKKTDFPEIVELLMAWTLCQHGFVKDPLVQKKWLYVHGKIVADPETLKITAGKKEVTLKINEGYMNSFALQELLKIQINKRTEEQRQAATIVAQAFIAVGIQIPQDIFIDVFERLYI